MILVFAGTSLALAGPPPFVSWKCLVYDGMVWNNEQAGTVIEDTGVFVTNPNPSQVSTWIRIFNKAGQEVWQGDLWNTLDQIRNIPSMGFGWMPLGWALNQAGYQTTGREKFSFIIYMSDPGVKPKWKCVVEVKQVIWGGPVNPLDMLGGSAPFEIINWCEANPEVWKKCAIIP